MKKSLWLLLCMFLSLTLASCSGQQDEIAHLEAEVHYLAEKRDIFFNVVNEQQQEIINLQNLIRQSEEQHDDIIASFKDNLYWVATFLGVENLTIDAEDIEKQENILTAHTSYLGNGIILTFRYWIYEDEISWALINYSIGPFAGPGFLDAGRTSWQWQEPIFSENFRMRFYRHLDFGVYEYFDEEITHQNWQAQVIKHMRTHTDIQLADIWFEGSRLVADLTPAGALRFNWGTLGSEMHGRSLISSLATLPNVTEIEMLVGGQRGVSTDHFYFGMVRLD